MREIFPPILKKKKGKEKYGYIFIVYIFNITGGVGKIKYVLRVVKKIYTKQTLLSIFLVCVDF